MRQHPMGLDPAQGLSPALNLLCTMVFPVARNACNGKFGDLLVEKALDLFRAIH